MSAKIQLKSILNKPLTKDPETIIVEDDDENEDEIDEGYRAEYGDNFHYEDENGYWAPNTDFNSDGLPVDEYGNVIEEDDDCRFRDDFDYSKFYASPDDDEDEDDEQFASSNDTKTQNINTASTTIKTNEHKCSK